MADVDADYDFSGTDAGSSDAVPIEAGQIRKGGYMVIKVRHHLPSFVPWQLHCCRPNTAKSMP